MRNAYVRMSEDGALVIRFVDEEDDPFCSGDVWYYYCLDAGNAAALLGRIPRRGGSPVADVEAWLDDERFDPRYCGGDMMQALMKMGLHGTRTVMEDYPGGIHRNTEF